MCRWALFLTDRSLLLCLLSLKSVRSHWYLRTLLHLGASQAKLHSPSHPVQHNEMPPLTDQYFIVNFSPLKATFLPLRRICKISSKFMLKYKQKQTALSPKQGLSAHFERLCTKFPCLTRSISWGQRTPADCTMTASARKTPSLIWDLTLTCCVGLGKPLNLSASQLFCP